MEFIEKDKRLVFELDEVLYVDTERKNLPFKLGSKCKVKSVDNWEDFLKVMKAGCGLEDFTNSPNRGAFYGPIKVVIVDSLTRITFLLSEYLKSKMITGFDFWRDFGDMIERLLMTWSSKGRFIIFTAIDELVQDNNTISRRTVKISGRMSGSVESYFAMTLFTHFASMKQRPQCYQFETNKSNPKSSAKSAEGMFDELFIQNDLAFVLGSYYDYYDMKNNPEFVVSPILIVGESGSGKSTSTKYLFEKEITYNIEPKEKSKTK